MGCFLSSVCASTSGQFTVNLFGCSIDDHCCKFLIRGLSRCSTPTTGQLSISLQHNGIHEDGAHYITQILRNSSIVQRLYLSDNTIGEAGLKYIVEALATSSSLVELHLRSSSVKINEGRAVQSSARCYGGTVL